MDRPSWVNFKQELQGRRRDTLPPKLTSDPIRDFPISRHFKAGNVPGHHAINLYRAISRRVAGPDFCPMSIEGAAVRRVFRGERGHKHGFLILLMLEEYHHIAVNHFTDGNGHDIDSSVRMKHFLTVLPQAASRMEPVVPAP